MIPAVEDSFIWAGRVVKTQGLKGEVRIALGGGDFKTFSQGQIVWIGKDGEGKKALTVESSRSHKQAVLLTFREVKEIREAEQLVGGLVYINPADLQPLPPDEFYWYQLQGLKVRTEAGEILGTVQEVMPTGSNDVFVVRNEGQEILIPATEEVVIRVDLQEGVMIVHLLEGLLPEDDF